MRRAVLPRAVILGLLLAAAILWQPPDHPRIRLCGFYLITGHNCPLCGLTRGVCAAAKGEWRQAFTFHPLSPLALAWLAAAFLSAVAASMGRDWSPPLKLRSRLALTALVLLVACWPLHLSN